VYIHIWDQVIFCESGKDSVAGPATDYIHMHKYNFYINIIVCMYIYIIMYMYIFIYAYYLVYMYMYIHISIYMYVKIYGTR